LCKVELVVGFGEVVPFLVAPGVPVSVSIVGLILANPPAHRPKAGEFYQTPALYGADE